MEGILPAPDDFRARVQSNFRVLTSTAKKIWSLPFEKCKLDVEAIFIEPKPSITFRLIVAPEMLNGAGALHGGCAATLIDDLTTVFIAAISQPGLYSKYGVSRNIRVAFFKPVTSGADVRVVCKMENVGRRLVLLRAKVYDTRNGRLCISGENEKMNTDSKLGSVI